MSISQAIAKISYVSRKAGCKTMPIVQISFASIEDRARFEYELKKEFDDISSSPIPYVGISGCTILGVKVRLM